MWFLRRYNFAVGVAKRQGSKKYGLKVNWHGFMPWCTIPILFSRAIIEAEAGTIVKDPKLPDD